MDQFIAQFSDKKSGTDIRNDVANNKDMTILIQAMRKIMGEKNPPKECLYGLKVVKDCIEKFNNKFKNQVKNELIELIYEVAIYRIQVNDDLRGNTYFENPDDEKAIKQFGASYIRLALDCIRVWSLWFPDFKIYGERLEKEQGYLPDIVYFKQDLINKHIPKIQVAATLLDDNGSIQNKMRQVNDQLINYLQTYTEINSFLQDELEKINIQIIHQIFQIVKIQFLEKYILTYPKLKYGRISYEEFRMQLQSILQQNQGCQKEESQKQQTINQSPQQKQFQQIQQSQIIKNDEQKEIENLKSHLKLAQLECEKFRTNIQQNNKEIQEIQFELNKYKIETEDLKIKNSNDSLNYERLLKGFQQQIDNYKHLFELSLKKSTQEQQELITQYQQEQKQNQQKEIENFNVERNSLLEQQKIQQQKRDTNISEYEYMILKQKYDDLYNKYIILKEENVKFNQIHQKYGDQIENQSKINQSLSKQQIYQDINSNVVFYNCKGSDIQKLESNKNQIQSIIDSNMNDVSKLIHPHKNVSDQYRLNRKKQFKGNFINRYELELQLNQINLHNFKKASLNKLDTLYQTNQIEIKSRQQLIYDQNKQEFVSTTISITNKGLQVIQFEIKENNQNIQVNKETKSTLIQSQQTIIHEFIREPNVMLHKLTQINISVNFDNSILYLPSILINCIKFNPIEAISFKSIKKYFSGKILATQLLPIGCKAELIQLSEQGQLLNQMKLKNKDSIIESKYGFKAVLQNQLEFYLELIITPCDEFLFRGFTPFDEEKLQFILNGLSNLYS
ncbi:unnamed protein product [Paramecium pentaurelia]|uniref:Uncharacterized protein n=1 Tax=Paramecium pentaurelia TaxID=43138 RepID=A0A8S1X296_9CILI|nr:unnamed protein product [Paramecium pentaurelia]